MLNRNILANARHAYALYWSTPASDWNAYYHYFQVFAATFRPAPALPGLTAAYATHKPGPARPRLAAHRAAVIKF